MVGKYHRHRANTANMTKAKHFYQQLVYSAQNFLKHMVCTKYFNALVINVSYYKVVIYNYVLCWLYFKTKSVVIALILFLVFCGYLLYWV